MRRLPLVVGLFAVVALAGANLYHLGQRVSTLQGQCLDENTKLRAEVQAKDDALVNTELTTEQAMEWLEKHAPANAEEAARMLGAQPVCDGVELTQMQFRSGAATSMLGIQKDIVTAVEAYNYFRNIFWALVVGALTLLVVFVALPYSWYFLIARLREIGDALRGR